MIFKKRLQIENNCNNNIFEKKIIPALLAQHFRCHTYHSDRQFHHYYSH